MRTVARLALVLAASAGLGAAASLPPPAVDPPQNRNTRFITFAEAAPILERVAPDLAASYAAKPLVEREPAWLEWVSRHDAEIRARVERGDEDSLVNLLLFGTSFTRQPRALNDSSRLGGPSRAADIVRARLADLVEGIAAPGANERLQFARAVVMRRGPDPSTAAGRAATAAYLRSLMQRTSGEMASYMGEIAAVRAAGGPEMATRSTLYRARGLSSDASIRADFAIDRTLEALHARGLLERAMHRVAVVGPGLDFTDKAEGHDFYPPQTTQPFALIDSLRRLGLAASDLTVTTIDVSARVNGHLQAARRRALVGPGYSIVLPRERQSAWTPELLRFWQRAGGRIGDEIRGSAAPSGVEARTVGIRPAFVRALDVRDMNIVVERIDPLAGGETFDLIVATNVLVYYAVVDQSLALGNIASMLRPGGLLLSNNVLVELPATPVRSIGHTDAIYSDSPDDRDQIVWYRRM